MRNLFLFLIKHSPWLVFLFYALISLVLLLRFNPYHQSVYLSSANRMVGEIYAQTDNITGYFNLRDINYDLLERNGHLEMELLRLRSELKKAQGMKLLERTETDSALYNYDFTIAHVVNNSFTSANNYITLDKGSKDSISTEMGVVDQNGIVGIVSVVSDNFSVAISLLNPKLRLSCKVKGTDYFGSLMWDGKDSRYVILEELPRHVKFVIGDTIVTSGYSSVFPEGVIVGTVREYMTQKDDNFYALKVELSTDFSQLSDVRIIRNQKQKEQLEIEKEARRNE